MSSTERKSDQKEKTIEVRKSIVINASPEVIFKAITDPQQLTQWFPDQAILEPRVGGKMKFSFQKEKSQEEKNANPSKNTIKDGLTF